ncbi:hypothetical protein HOU02_gp487 [Caulobacter phage CcrBL9]|uniref:Uncharacterized protein n=1 Tax=Caulobacter phage CcrBL9 TaxID=2283270 RepID=A0A385EEP6_9CAUD|nr:hypothetical protein HOU02_gp487 [Caulobacter phage CcrBL9]AXQ69238.1 hypothetical protein CcrBL9_gp214c [Caulobacter phage CcrBL9]
MSHAYADLADKLADVTKTLCAPPEVQDLKLYERVKKRVQERFDAVNEFLDLREQTRLRQSTLVEMEALRETVAIERERARKALMVPERLGDQEVWVFRTPGGNVHYPSKHTGFLAELAYEFPYFQVMLTTKQRAKLKGHPGGERDIGDGAEVAGDWRMGYVELTLPGDQVRGGETSTLKHEPRVLVMVSQDDLIVRAPG